MSAYRSPHTFETGPSPSGRHVDTRNARPHLCDLHVPLSGIFHPGGGGRGIPQVGRFANTYSDVFGDKPSGTGSKVKDRKFVFEV